MSTRAVFGRIENSKKRISNECFNPIKKFGKGRLVYRNGCPAQKLC